MAKVKTEATEATEVKDDEKTEVTEPKQTLLDLHVEKHALLERLAELEAQTAETDGLLADREIIQGLFETLGTVSLPDELDEILTLRDGIREATEAITEAYKALCPQAVKPSRGRKRGSGAAKPAGEKQGKRLSTPINKALKENGPLTDEQIMNTPKVVAYKQKNTVVDAELKAELEKMVADGRLKLVDGLYSINKE